MGPAITRRSARQIAKLPPEYQATALGFADGERGALVRQDRRGRWLIGFFGPDCECPRCREWFHVDQESAKHTLISTLGE